MKTLFGFRTILATLFLGLSLIACKEEQIKETEVITPFLVKDIKGNIVTQFEPKQLSLVEENLIATGRQIDAKNLLKTYNIKTGRILPTIKLPLNSLRTSGAYSVYIDGYVQDNSWQYNVPLGGVVGSTGLHKRLEAFQININPFASGLNTIRYEAHVENTGWQGLKNPGEVAGTIGKNKDIEAVRFYVNSNFATQVLYRAHVAGIGWMSWVSSPTLAGTTGQHKRLEAFQLTMLIY